MITYDVDVVGLNTTRRVTDIDKFRRYISKAMTAIGASGVKNINARINACNWKKHPRTIPRSIDFNAKDWEVTIYSDPAISPHAIYQEEGVREHEMRYLLGATRPIPLEIGRVTIFRWATERWMGVPHPFVDPKSGLVMHATGWVHPGYEGKHFFRDGIKDTMIEATNKLKGIVIRVARGE